LGSKPAGNGVYVPDSGEDRSKQTPPGVSGESQDRGQDLLVEAELAVIEAVETGAPLRKALGRQDRRYRLSELSFSMFARVTEALQILAKKCSVTNT
jgi:hypothetical protein